MSSCVCVICFPLLVVVVRVTLLPLSPFARTVSEGEGGREREREKEEERKRKKER